MTFFREFTAAVEQKQVAQQEAEKARFLVERAEFYKKAAVIQVQYLGHRKRDSFTKPCVKHYLYQAEGDTEAAELLASAFAKVKDPLCGI